MPNSGTRQILANLPYDEGRTLRPRSVHSKSYRLLVEQLKSARQESGLTMREVAARLGKVHSFVHKVEIAERELNVIELMEYCRALGVDFIPFITALHQEFVSLDAIADENRVRE